MRMVAQQESAPSSSFVDCSNKTGNSVDVTAELATAAEASASPLCSPPPPPPPGPGSSLSWMAAVHLFAALLTNLILEYSAV